MILSFDGRLFSIPATMLETWGCLDPYCRMIYKAYSNMSGEKIKLLNKGEITYTDFQIFLDTNERYLDLVSEFRTKTMLSLVNQLGSKDFIQLFRLPKDTTSRDALLEDMDHYGFNMNTKTRIELPEEDLNKLIKEIMLEVNSQDATTL